MRTAPWIFAASGLGICTFIGLAVVALTPACKHDTGDEGEGDINLDGEGAAGEGEGEGDCAGVPDVVGLVVRVVDNVTQFRVCTALVRITDGDYIENMGVTSNDVADCEYHGASGRPGNYQLDVTATGYTAFTAAGEDVPAGECGQPVQSLVTVRLNPQ